MPIVGSSIRRRSVLVMAAVACAAACGLHADGAQTAAVSEEVLSRYEGAYRLGPDTELIVRKLAAGRISIQIGTHQPFELLAFGPDEFFHPSGDIQVRFARDGSGRVGGLVFTEMGLEGRLARTK